MPWETIDLKLISPTAFNDLEAIISALQTALAPIVGSNFPPTFGGIIGGLVAILNVIGAFVTEKNDIMAFATQTFVTQTETIVNDTFNAGVSFLLVPPDPKKSFVLTPSNAISTAVKAVDDVADPHRPNLSVNAFTAGIGILITAPGLVQFQNLLSILKKIISTRDIENLYARIVKAVDVLLTPKKISPTTAPYPPFWIGYTLKEILPCFQTVYNATITFLEELRGGSTLVSGSITNLVSILTTKFTEIANLMVNVSNTINTLASIPMLEGIYVLHFNAVGGNNLIKRELQSLNLSTFAGNSYSLFVLLVGGAPSAQAFVTLGELFGL